MVPDSAVGLDRLRALGFEDATVPRLVLDAARLDARDAAVSGTRAALGTRVSIAAIAPSAARGETAVVAAFAELDRLAGIFSRYESGTPLSYLNATGCVTHPPPELTRVTARALALHGASGGAFDVTVKPILDLCALGRPGEGELREAASLVGAQHVALDRRRIRLGRTGMGITLDGIAKGYIVDRMASTLERHGVRRYLIDAGGDIRARGRSARGTSWAIGVRDPRGGDEFPDVIGLQDGAVATSGGYARFLSGAPECHHIVSPDTGRSPDAVAGVSVAAPDALTADALATAVFVLGRDAGLRLVERAPRCAALVLDPDGSPHRSRRWARLRVPAHDP